MITAPLLPLRAFNHNPQSCKLGFIFAGAYIFAGNVVFVSRLRLVSQAFASLRL